MATVQWFVDGRKNFTGPKIDLGALQNGEVVGITAESTNERASPEESGDLESKGKVSL